MLRRLFWFLDKNVATAWPLESKSMTRFDWRSLPLPLESREYPGGTKIYQRREWKDNEKKIQLVWDGQACDRFVSESELRPFLIRFIYNISPNYLIPSEMLADAEMVYADGEWVDSFREPNRGKRAVISTSPIQRPVDRKIMLDSHPLFAANAKQYALKPPAPPGLTAHFSADTRSVECSLRYRAGGFYGKKLAK